MAGLGKLGLPTTPREWLWPGLTGFFALLVLLSLAQLGGVGESERVRAFEESQRLIINPGTGAISIAKKSSAAQPEPEKAEMKEAPAAESPAEPASKEESPKEETPKEETPEKPSEPPAEKPAEPKPEAAPAAVTTPAAESPASPEPSASTPAATPAPAAQSPEPAAAPAQPATDAAPSLRTQPLSGVLVAPTRTKDSLVSAPAPEVSEKIDGMMLPKVVEKGGTTPSKLYARPFHRTSDQALLSFVVLDGGLDPQSVGLILSLPQEVTVAYSPYAKGEGYSEYLRAAGHEVWAMLPTMDEGYPANDPGPMGLVNRMPPEEILRRTHLVMSAVPGAVGLVLPANETISQYKDSLKPVLTDMRKRGLLMMQGNAARSLDQLSTDADLKPLLSRANLVLDAEADQAQIKSKLAGLIDAVEENREYVVVLSARPLTLQVLNEWLHETKLEEPITLAPLSAIYQPVAAPEETAAEDKGGEHKKPKPAPSKKKKALPQDQYLKPQGEKKEGHEKKEGGGH